MKTASFPSVSVLIPAYNEEKYIYRTLAALVAQDYPDYEIIIADNASSDRTAFVVQQFINQQPVSAVRIKLVHEERRGTNFARESARQQASGQIIAQMDADCVPAANWLRKGVTALTKNRQRVAVTGPYDYFDGGSRMRFFSLASQKLIYPFISDMVQFSRRGAILIGGNAFIYAGILEKAGGYNTAFTFYGDDVELGNQLSRFGHVAYIPGLVQQSSSRRYQANGFWEVNKKYQDCFWNLVWRKDVLLTTAENSHPR
jgi:glycosyltransferase involved in cell wall biosynthesis